MLEVFFLAMSNNIESPWKISPKGACWCWYDEILDQELLSLLKPEDGFKLEKNDCNYSVKVNDNGSIVVFKKATNNTRSQTAYSFQASTSQKDLYKDRS